MTNWNVRNSVLYCCDTRDTRENEYLFEFRTVFRTYRFEFVFGGSQEKFEALNCGYFLR